MQLTTQSTFTPPPRFYKNNFSAAVGFNASLIRFGEGVGNWDLANLDDLGRGEGFRVKKINGGNTEYVVRIAQKGRKYVVRQTEKSEGTEEVYSGTKNEAIEYVSNNYQ